jgi:hypothetical protein
MHGKKAFSIENHRKRGNNRTLAGEAAVVLMAACSREDP